MKYIIIYVSILAVICGCASSPSETFVRFHSGKIDSSSIDSLSLKIEPEGSLRFHGEYNYDDVGMGDEAMMYPGDTGAMFVASLIAHAVVVESVKAKQMREAQSLANKVLVPYNPYVKFLDDDYLLTSIATGIDNYYSFNVTPEFESEENSGKILLSEPVFFMTQDQKQIIVKNAISLYDNDKGIETHKNIVEVYSAPISTNNPFDYWISENELPYMAARLYAESIKLFINDAMEKYSDTVAEQDTFSYESGGKNRYERGYQLAVDCNRTVIRTLRGWLKSYVSDGAQLNDAEVACDDYQFVDISKTVDVFGVVGNDDNLGF